MKAKKKKTLRSLSVRLDGGKVIEAYGLGIELGDLFRHALDEEILRRGIKCPTCGVAKEQVGSWTRYKK